MDVVRVHVCAWFLISCGDGSPCILVIRQNSRMHVVLLADGIILYLNLFYDDRSVVAIVFYFSWFLNFMMELLSFALRPVIIVKLGLHI